MASETIWKVWFIDKDQNIVAEVWPTKTMTFENEQDAQCYVATLRSFGTWAWCEKS